jgi:hypothetical protein
MIEKKEFQRPTCPNGAWAPHRKNRTGNKQEIVMYKLKKTGISKP